MFSMERDLYHDNHTCEQLLKIRRKSNPNLQIFALGAHGSPTELITALKCCIIVVNDPVWIIYNIYIYILETPLL